MQAEMRRVVVAGTALNSAVVRALREYGGQLQEDYLARILGRDAAEIRTVVTNLEKEHVVQRQGEKIVLTVNGTT